MLYRIEVVTYYIDLLLIEHSYKIPFFVKRGFDKYEKTVKNFFIDNYNEEITDGNLTCTDLIYYSKDLKKKVKDK